jgi:hypothetical protein
MVYEYEGNKIYFMKINTTLKYLIHVPIMIQGILKYIHCEVSNYCKFYTIQILTILKNEKAKTIQPSYTIIK